MSSRVEKPVTLTKRAFGAMLETYQPSRYEVFGEQDPRFRRPMHHALKCRDRLYRALQTGLPRVPAGSATILDFGPYPGSLLRLLRLWDWQKRWTLIGAGLMASREFIDHMKSDGDISVLEVNLDPLNRQFMAKGYPDKVPLGPGAVDLIFALEIIEHLSSPVHLLAEAFRLLRPGGHLVMTTPNVTRIGNVLKLLAGRSPNDRLAPPGYFNPDDEWQPHVREYSMVEVKELLATAGFVTAEGRFFLGEDTQECRRPLRQHVLDWAKLPFALVPHLRGSLLVVGRKEI